MRSLSLAAGLSESAIKHMIGGRSQRPIYRNLWSIAQVLQVSVADLTGAADDIPPPPMSQPGEFVENQAELQLLTYWRVLDVAERSYLLNLVRLSALGK